MHPGLRPGVRIEAKDTQTNRSCGVKRGAWGRIIFVDSQKVSIYLEKGTPGAGWIEASCSADTLQANFHIDFHNMASGYAGHIHYRKRYPEDFFPPSRAG